MRLIESGMHRLMKRHPRLRRALWKFTAWYQRQRCWHVAGRVMHWVWCYSAPLGSCDACREPTWNPVTFQIQLSVGRTGHYYCETCGAPVLAAAEAMGEFVVRQ